MRTTPPSRPVGGVPLCMALIRSSRAVGVPRTLRSPYARAVAGPLGRCPTRRRGDRPTDRDDLTSDRLCLTPLHWPPQTHTQHTHDTHTHAHIHTRTHTPRHTHAHAHTPARTHTRTHRREHTHAHTPHSRSDAQTSSCDALASQQTAPQPLDSVAAEITASGVASNNQCQCDATARAFCTNWLVRVPSFALDDDDTDGPIEVEGYDVLDNGNIDYRLLNYYFAGNETSAVTTGTLRTVSLERVQCRQECVDLEAPTRVVQCLPECTVDAAYLTERVPIVDDDDDGAAFTADLRMGLAAPPMCGDSAPITTNYTLRATAAADRHAFDERAACCRASMTPPMDDCRWLGERSVCMIVTSFLVFFPHVYGVFVFGRMAYSRLR
mmetsp:Transcript_55193/g.135394  ORF Transcript_55193/g.135394 Transcript_55193/m.135394 type:complete len:381 (+) Transcript_55193:830-1972(+)